MSETGGLKNGYVKGADNEKEIIRNESGRTVAVVSDFSDRASGLLERLVCSIQAKPIIDILAEFPKESNLADYKEILADNGYICMSQNADRISFNKGYTEEGFADRVFHLHLRYYGDNDELYFRDYLIEHSDVAAEYERLKLRLWKEYEHDRNGYTDAKTEFVKSYTEQARKLYRH